MSITQKNLDAGIFAMGERITQLVRLHIELDERFVRLSRLGQTKPSTLDDVMAEVREELSETEWRLIYTDAATPDGHAEKLKILERLGFAFDPDGSWRSSGCWPGRPDGSVLPATYRPNSNARSRADCRRKGVTEKAAPYVVRPEGFSEIARSIASIAF
jgi:hypothetical protein